MLGRFANRSALVTGAAQGIGAAVASRLAAEGAGVVLADLNTAGAEERTAAIRREGGRVEALTVDVCSPAAVAEVIERAETLIGQFSLVVTSAGVIHTRHVLEVSESDWDDTLDTNLKGTFFVLQEASRRMVARGTEGRMVALSSISARGGRIAAADYAASKAGVISVVRSLALALAPHRITINAICPGIVDTPMTRTIHRDRAQLSGISSDESLASMVESIPLGRIETPDDVANAVLFMLSDEAAYITGQALNVCGGMEFD